MRTIHVLVRRIPHLASPVPVLAILLAMAASLAFAANAPATIRLGVYDAQEGQVGAPESAETLDRYASMVGRNPDIVMDYSNITDPLLTRTEVANLSDRGETPLISWQLYQAGYGGPTIPLSRIAEGAYDADLRRAAAEAKAMPFREILIRIGHEMNGDWYGWSGDPSAFVSAWRHVVALFRAEGVTNVKWVWSVNVDNGSYPFKAYFPGDEWVDYTGLDGYNWGTAGIGVNRWQTLAQVFSSSYDELTQISSKPVIITEVSSSEAGGDKADWIREGFLRTIPQRLPRVDAVVWFDRDQEENWRIDSSVAALDAYREVVASSIYGGPVQATPDGTRHAGALAVDAIAMTPQEGGAPGGAVAIISIPHGKVAAEKAAHRHELAYALSDKARLRISIRGPGHAKAHLTLIERAARQGQVRLSRLLHGALPEAGAYRVRVTADEASGVKSPPRQIRFRVRRG